MTQEDQNGPGVTRRHDPNMVQEAHEAKNDSNMLSWGTLPPSRSPVASWPRGVVLLGGRRQEGFSPLDIS